MPVTGRRRNLGFVITDAELLGKDDALLQQKVMTGGNKTAAFPVAGKGELGRLPGQKSRIREAAVVLPGRCCWRNFSRSQQEYLVPETVFRVENGIAS